MSDLSDTSDLSDLSVVLTYGSPLFGYIYTYCGVTEQSGPSNMLVVNSKTTGIHRFHRYVMGPDRCGHPH